MKEADPCAYRLTITKNRRARMSTLHERKGDRVDIEEKRCLLPNAKIGGLCVYPMIDGRECPVFLDYQESQKLKAAK